MKDLLSIPAAKTIDVYDMCGNTYVHIEALEKKDFPNNIAENGRFLLFKLEDGKIEYLRGGHVWLSKADQEGAYKYLVMRSISSLADKKFRKCKYKSIEDAAEKISTYANKVYAALTDYTGGYPYTRGI